ncbi:unnamed protein product [Durusdinium trenchii]|uniref:CCHC-type domain-containing protein n=1 Tax=Durusdinium trenchii TaxID=1381693 RepID=A0ABP0JW81_9DINO
MVARSLQKARWDEPADTPQEDDDDQWYDPPSEAPEAASWHASSYGYGYHEGTDDEPWKLHAEELLPEFLQGWYLLADSGLDSLERNMVQTALQEDFSVQRVAKELRLQWPDEELKRRDQQTKNAGFWANEPDQELDLEDGPDVGLWMDDLTGQGHALFQAAEEQAQEAYAAIQQARRTLKEARSRQHQVKLSRQYYKTTFQRPHRPYPPRSDGMTCLKCGKGHRTNECPEKQNSDGKHQSHVTEEAPFVCYSEEAALATNGIDQCRTTYEAVQAGCAVIDGGATKTLGSVEAIQAVMDQNIAKHGSSRIQEVDFVTVPNMVSQMKKADLMAALEEFGETPPAKWTVTELRSRLLQLHEEHGINLSKNKRTELREMVIQLNKASARKSTVAQHCADLGIAQSGNETKAQLQKAAMIRIYKTSKPDAYDPVGFGKGASLTYAEIKEDKQYCTWVKTTWQEDPNACCPQLARLAQWLLNQDVKMTKDSEPTRTKTGYRTQEPEPKVVSLKQEPKGTPARSSAASSASVSSSTQALELIQHLAETMKELKEEIVEVKGNMNPRKERKSRGSEGTSDSFDMI